MNNEENYPTQCHPVIKPKKKKYAKAAEPDFDL